MVITTPLTNPKMTIWLIGFEITSAISERNGRIDKIKADTRCGVSEANTVVTGETSVRYLYGIALP